MKQKLKKILLIDDSEADNFIHARVIRKAKVTEEIIAVQGGQEALDYLTTRVNENYPNPELVFLDINMPGMNGWQFLEKYRELPTEQKAGIAVCMLTTSFVEKDKITSEQYAEIQDYSHKPLTEKMLTDVIAKFFPDLIES